MKFGIYPILAGVMVLSLSTSCNNNNYVCASVKEKNTKSNYVVVNNKKEDYKLVLVDGFNNGDKDQNSQLLSALSIDDCVAFWVDKSSRLYYTNYKSIRLVSKELCRE